MKLYIIPCTECFKKTDGITASGTLAIEGTNQLQADWAVRNQGTEEIYIEGWNILEQLRIKGGAINGNKLDVYMDSHIAALNAGRYKADIWIVEEEDVN